MKKLISRKKNLKAKLSNSDQNRIFYGYVLLFWTKNKSSKEDHSFSLKKGRHHLFQGEGTSCVKMPWRIRDILLAAYQKKKWKKSTICAIIKWYFISFVEKKQQSNQLEEGKISCLCGNYIRNFALTIFNKNFMKSTVSSEWIFFHIVLYRDSFRCLTRFGAKVGQVGTVQKFKNFTDFLFRREIDYCKRQIL